MDREIIPIVAAESTPVCPNGAGSQRFSVIDVFSGFNCNYPCACTFHRIYFFSPGSSVSFSCPFKRPSWDYPVLILCAFVFFHIP